jgi:hypothetical protein
MREKGQEYKDIYKIKHAYYTRGITV